MYVCVCVCTAKSSRAARKLPFHYPLHWGGGKCVTPLPVLLHFTLDMYLSVKQSGIKCCGADNRVDPANEFKWQPKTMKGTKRQGNRYDKSNDFSYERKGTPPLPRYINRKFFYKKWTLKISISWARNRLAKSITSIFIELFLAEVFLGFRVLVQCEMQSVSSRVWTCVAVSISYDDNRYTTGTSLYICI